MLNLIVDSLQKKLIGQHVPAGHAAKDPADCQS